LAIGGPSTPLLILQFDGGGEILERFDRVQFVRDLAFSPDSKYLAIAGPTKVGDEIRDTIRFLRMD